MTPDQLINHFGTQTKAAVALGTSQSTVCEWKRGGHIPFAWQKYIEFVAPALKAHPEGWIHDLRRIREAAERMRNTRTLA